MKDLTVQTKFLVGGADLKSYVYQFHRAMIEGNLTLVYEGEVTQNITKAFTALAEKNMGDADEDTKTKIRVHHVMVECLQNICKHADDTTFANEIEGDGSGIFIVGQSDKGYTITTGNMVNNNKILGITEMVTKINSMSKEELKEYYKEKMKVSRLNEKAGAGLGFIDIVKKTGNGLDIHFENINENISFFILNTYITKKQVQ